MKKLLVIIIGILLTTTTVRASHLLGGEITWQCLTSGTNAGKLIFTFKLYQACYQGAAAEGSTQSISNPLYGTYGGPSSISVSRPGGAVDFSPKCYNSSLQLSCGQSVASGGERAMSESVYTSAPIQINGIPALAGSEFYWTSCCRPNMLNANGSGYYLRATMYRYTDPATNVNLSMGSTTGGASCYDSSPHFVESPGTVICYGYQFTYNHNAADDELDSLHYEWTLPMQSATNGVTWKTGYSTTSPLPNASHNSLNVPATLHGLTGEVSFKTMAYPGNGYHVTGVMVTAYKCRQKVAEIVRDIPVIIVSCPPTPTIPPLSNTPPTVTFKWAPSDPVSIPLPAGDTVWAGDAVEFYVVSTDIQFLPGFIGQTNYLAPSGSQFGNLYSDTTTGCNYPPCATLDTNSIYYNSTTNKWEGQYGVATRFNWHTTCNHLAQVNSCFTKSNTYTFVFKVLDNWCPAPGMNFQTFTVTVLAPPALEPPQLKCVKVLANGNARISWTKPVTKAQDTLSSFRRYLIMRSDSGGFGPGVVYDTLHSVYNIDSLFYLDVTANANTRGKYYIVHGISSCNDQGDSVLGDTISTMHLDAVVYNSGNSVALDWNDYNPSNHWGKNTTGEYYIWQIIGTDTTLIDTTTESWDTLQINLCYPTLVDYFITVVDTSSPWGCVSNSTIAGGTVGDNIAPPPVVLDSVSFNDNNDIRLGWAHTSGDVGPYYIYKQGQANPFDSVMYPVNTYLYTRLGTDPMIMNFAIQAKDTCENKNTTGFAQYSMRTKIQDVIRCDTNKKVVISWNHYNPSWAGGTQSYRIFRSDNLGPYNFIDSVSALDTIFNDTSIQAGNYYRYKVRSWENGMNRAVWSAWDSVTVKSLIAGYIIGAPDLRCVSWTNDSTILLQWDTAYNPMKNFHKYTIYHSTNGSSFVKLDSIKGTFRSDNTAHIIQAYTFNNVSGSEHHFYLTNSSGCDGLQESGPTATLSAIDVTVTSTSDSTNQLDWNKVSGAILGANYLVYRDGGMIGTPLYNNETASDKWVICEQDVKYRVEYPDGTGKCVSSSKETDGHFEDNTPPAKQFVDSASMRRDTTFTGMVGWSKNTSPDVVKYYAMYCTNGSYKILDTVYVGNPLYYEDVLNAPLKNETQYTVVAIDSCDNNTLTSLNFDCHSTMMLRTTMDFCDQSIRLKWNLYTDFISGAGVEYRVYASANGGQFTEIGRTLEDKFKHKDIVNGNNYCYYVQAWDNSGAGPFSSSTAVGCLDAIFIDQPDFAYLTYATVHDTNLVRLCMKVDLESNIGEYWVKRSTERDANYKVIATIPIPDPLTASDSTFCYEDNEVQTDRYSYYYKVDVVDPCGTVGITSNHGRTIVLHVTADNEKNLNVLKWNQYEEWSGGVNEYEVYRNEGSKMKLLRSLIVRDFATDPTVEQKGEEITFTDDVSEQSESGNGEFCYYVLAKEGSNTFPGTSPAVSMSNLVCAVQMPMFYVPSAFTPNGDGLNDRFLPLGAFHDIKSYNLEVYNRWGDRIFNSDKYTGPDAGWDGTHNGKEVPSGAYVYIVKYKAADGTDYEEKGTVTLTR